MQARGSLHVNAVHIGMLNGQLPGTCDPDDAGVFALFRDHQEALSARLMAYQMQQRTAVGSRDGGSDGVSTAPAAAASSSAAAAGSGAPMPPVPPLLLLFLRKLEQLAVLHLGHMCHMPELSGDGVSPPSDMLAYGIL